MAHSASHSIARNEQMNRINRSVHDIHANIVLSKESLRHQLAMAKYQARREIDLRIAQKAHVIDLNRVDEIERVGIIARRKQHSKCLTLLLIGQFVCTYIAIGLLFCLFL